MSEFLAEASVLIQANTKLFRAELAAALATVPKAIEIPVIAVGGGGKTASSAARQASLASEELAGSSKLATSALLQEDVALNKAAVSTQRKATADAESAAAARASAIRTKEISKGLQAQALSAVGLRGAIIGANSAFLAATAGAILFGKAIQSAAQFQTQLAVFAATTGATAGQLQDVSAAAKQLGADLTLPGVNAQDAAVAMTELAKAGLSVQDSIDGARGILQLATAAGIDNAQATELAASALNAFGLAGSDASHVADVFANAANDAQGSITDVAIANQQASAAARQAGLTLEQTAAILTIFARNGIKGSDAGTSLRTLMIRLINPTKKASDIINELGLHLRDATGGINLGFFDEFARKTANLTKAERDQDAAIIAGQDAFRGLTILSREGGVELSNQIERLNKVGTASDIAAARTSGLAGAAENLKNQLATAGLTFGQSLVPGLTSLANLAADAVGEVNNLAQQLSDLRDQAAEPINVVVNFVKGITGQDDPKKAVDDALPTKEDVQGRLRQAFSLKETGPDFIHQINELGDEAVAALKDSELGTGVLPLTLDFPTLKEARAQVEDLVADLNKATAGVGGDPARSAIKLNETVAALQALQAEEAKGTFGTKNFAKSLDPLIEKLQNLSGTKVVIPPIEVPANLGQVPESVPKFGSDWSKGFKSGFEQDMQSGNTFTGGFVNGLIQQAFGPAAAAASAAGAATGEAFKAATVAALSDLKLAVAQAGGNQGQQLSILRGREAKQAEFLNRLLARPQDAKTVALAQKNAAKLEQTRGAIQQILDAQTAAENKRASDAKTAAQAAKTAREKADQAVLDSFAPEQNRIDIAQIRAGATVGVQDNIAVQNVIIATALRERKVIQDTVKVAKTRNAALRAIAKTIEAATAEKQTLEKQIATDLSEKQQTQFETRLGIAEAEGNIPQQISLINQRTKQLQAMGKAAEHQLFVVKGAVGLVEKGNLDLLHRPHVKNPEGGFSSVFSGTFGIDGGKTAVLPLVVGQKILTPDEAFQHFLKTGQHLGIFNTLKAAERYSELLHKEQASLGKAGKNIKKEQGKIDLQIQNLFVQREALQDQQVQQRIDLGQSILDLTGNKNPVLKALDAAVKETQQDINAAKKAGRSTILLQTQLNQFLKQRKDVLKDATDKSNQATTAFDLLKEANDTFNRNAGNLINPSQPFAGPTGFTADIAQFLIRRQPPTTSTASTAKADFTAPLVASNAELITVIKDNTDALRGKTDKSVPPGVRTARQQRIFADWSVYARRFQEA